MPSSVAVLLCVWLSAAFCASSTAVDDCPVVSVSVCVCTVAANVVAALELDALAPLVAVVAVAPLVVALEPACD